MRLKVLTENKMPFHHRYHIVEPTENMLISQQSGMLQQNMVGSVKGFSNQHCQPEQRLAYNTALLEEKRPGISRCLQASSFEKAKRPLASTQPAFHRVNENKVRFLRLGEDISAPHDSHPDPAGRAMNNLHADEGATTSVQRQRPQNKCQRVSGQQKIHLILSRPQKEIKLKYRQDIITQPHLQLKSTTFTTLNIISVSLASDLVQPGKPEASFDKDTRKGIDNALLNCSDRHSPGKVAKSLLDSGISLNNIPRRQLAHYLNLKGNSLRAALSKQKKAGLR